MEEKRNIDKAYLVIGNGIENLSAFPFKKSSVIIGIDRGAYLLARNGIRMEEAVGDFDSVSEIEFKLIEKFAKTITKLNPIKDDSDTAHAYSEYKDKANEIVIVGGIKGKRIEHFLANLSMAVEDTKVSIIDDDSKIYSLSASQDEYVFKKAGYYSFFPLIRSTITLSGFKYSLNDETLEKFDPLGLSNELNEDVGTLLVSEGKMLVIETKYQR